MMPADRGRSVKEQQCRNRNPAHFRRPRSRRNLIDFAKTYRSLFGVIPPLPEYRMALSGGVAPEFSLLAEQIRAHARGHMGYSTSS